MGVNKGKMGNNRLQKAAKQERHLREDGMLINVKGDVKLVVRLRKGTKCLNLEITREEKENMLTNFTHLHSGMYTTHSAEAKTAFSYTNFELHFQCKIAS
jgi:hypothetical protein